jgi:hypothetical protein
MPTHFPCYWRSRRPLITCVLLQAPSSFTVYLYGLSSKNVLYKGYWPSRRALVTCALLHGPSSFSSSVFLWIVIQKSTVQGHFTAAIGHVLRGLTQEGEGTSVGTGSPWPERNHLKMTISFYISMRRAAEIFADSAAGVSPLQIQSCTSKFETQKKEREMKVIRGSCSRNFLLQ